ncbi:MAG: MtaA/CmuA family methyltransferase [Candidatus Jettenia sp.]|nr:MAG: MtaA/CmuA family methyltransferase [Candidatus Jettenia sp.]
MIRNSVSNLLITMIEKERLLKVLQGKHVDRTPVICPGGMMTMASREVMVKTGCQWPAVHRDAKKMAELSIAMRSETGMENLGIPFCMTVEAEAFGGEVEDGDETTEPNIVHYPLKSVKQWKNLKELDPYKDGRLPTILECTAIVSRKVPDTPVIGNLVGPFSLATSLIEAMTLFKALLREPDDVHGLLSFLIKNSIKYGKALINNGADLIVISDPSATGEILGPKLFKEFAIPYLNRMINHIHMFEKLVIVHICGDISAIYGPLNELDAECISVDSAVNIKEARAMIPGKKLMGNVSTILLQKGPILHIQKISKNLLDLGVDILAPACGLSAKTPVRHIKAMTEAAILDS